MVINEKITNRNCNDYWIDYCYSIIEYCIHVGTNNITIIV